MTEFDKMKEHCEIHREYIMNEVRAIVESGDITVKNEFRESLAKAMSDIESRLLKRMDDRFERFDSKQDDFNNILRKIYWILISVLGVGCLILIGFLLGKGIDIGVLV